MAANRPVTSQQEHNQHSSTGLAENNDISNSMYTGQNDREFMVCFVVANRNISSQMLDMCDTWLYSYPPQDSWRTVNEMSYFMYTYTL